MCVHTWVCVQGSFDLEIDCFLRHHFKPWFGTRAFKQRSDKHVDDLPRLAHQV